MKYKKGWIFICLIIGLFSIASVCASDVNETAAASDDNHVELSQDSINDVIEDDNLKSNENDEVVNAFPKRFDNLDYYINFKI